MPPILLFGCRLSIDSINRFLLLSMSYRVDMHISNETLDFQQCRYCRRHQSLYRASKYIALEYFYIGYGDIQIDCLFESTLFCCSVVNELLLKHFIQ